MLVNLSKANVPAEQVRARFDELGKEIKKMQVTLTRQEVFDAMHKI